MPQGKRLCEHPALANFSREAKAKPRKGKAKKQAPPMVLALLTAFERMVVDESAELYPRAFAWYRIFRHWSSLRWDDTQALAPHSLQRRARGVVGSLERTKTSGPGKTIQVLPVFVSQDAWLEHE